MILIIDLVYKYCEYDCADAVFRSFETYQFITLFLDTKVFIL